MNYLYRHSQFSFLILLVVGGVLLSLSPLAASAADRGLALVMAAFLTLVLLTFGWLTVTVDREQVALRFGLGLVRKTFRLEDVRSLRVGRVPWIYGWGIRWRGAGWVYRVSGLDAVELELREGRLSWIGTDEPQALARAIEDALIARRHR